MANKRSHRGRPVWPLRYFYFPWEEENRRVRREVERAREARQRDEDRIRRFEEVQRRKRNWIKFTEIAEQYSERDGPVAPEKAAAEHERACAMLEHDLLAGNFEENGRSQVLFLFPGFTDRRMTRQRLQDAIDYNYDNRFGRSYLENCWITRNRYERLREWHNLGELPPRFRPQTSQNVSRAKSSDETATIKALAKAGEETAATKALASHESPQRFEPQESRPAPVATAGEETAATKALASHLRINPQLKRAGAQSRLRAQGFNLTGRGFQNRVWPRAREQAGLEAKAPPGAPRNPRA
jgi:hypothetical protein